MTEFTFDATGIDPDGFGVAPVDLYSLVIADVKDQMSRNGDRQVLSWIMIESGPHKGKRFIHYVTFLPKENKGAGMAINFLKTIGQPWEGVIKVDPENWVGARFNGVVQVENYKGRDQNKLGDISPVTDGRILNEEVQSRWVKKQSDPDAAPF